MQRRFNFAELTNSHVASRSIPRFQTLAVLLPSCCATAVVRLKLWLFTKLHLREEQS